MQVDLESLEPGSVVETPELLKKVVSTPRVIYTGSHQRWPKFMALEGEKWKPIYWPEIPGPGKWNLPRFEVTQDTQLTKGHANHGLTGQYWAGEHYSSGCDPEIFITDGKGKVIPARRVLPKKEAEVFTFYDGIQAEFCPGAGSCLEGLGSRIRHLLMTLQSAFRANPNYGHAKLSIQNNVLLTQEEMDKLEDEDVAFRCTESVNVYNDIPGPQEPRQYLWRFTGGHIHVGAGGGIYRKPRPILYNMVRAMDAILGVAGVSLARSFDTPERRKNYGRAGECRFPSHGLEYRVLSNFWLCSPLIYHLTFEIARFAYQLGESGLFPAIWDGTEEEIRECINNCDVELAQKLIKRNAGVYNKCFEMRWQPYGAKLVSKAMDTIMNGVETVVKDPTDIPGNWAFGDEAWGSYGSDVDNSKWRNMKCR